jgi:GNAT superfamily N-acetyltransferase
MHKTAPGWRQPTGIVLWLFAKNPRIRPAESPTPLEFVLSIQGDMNQENGTWGLREAENRAELLTYLGTASSATSHRATDLTWVITNIPDRDCNGVAWARLSRAEADVQISALVDQFRMHGLPAIWHLDPASEPPDLGPRLEALGCTPVGSEPCMGASLNALSREISRFPGLTVDRATTDDELDEWLAVRNTIAPEGGSFRRELYLSLGLGGRHPLHHYVARVDGQPAGCAQLFLGQRSAGLYSVGVAPAFRGRGIGTALVLTPLLVARTLGYDVGVVRPPADSILMYEHLGFGPITSPVSGYAL